MLIILWSKFNISIIFAEWQLSLGSSSSTIAESLPGSSVVETVALGCRYHRAGIEPSRTEPANIAQRFHLSAMQTEWTLVEEWAQAQAWDEIEALLFKKVSRKVYCKCIHYPSKKQWTHFCTHMLLFVPKFRNLNQKINLITPTNRSNLSKLLGTLDRRGKSYFCL